MDHRISRAARFAGVVMLLALASANASAQDAAAGKTKSKACAACHGADGNSITGTFPSLAGQTGRYIYLELKDFKEGRRKDPIMTPFAAPLSQTDMLDLAAYFSSQTLRPTEFVQDDTKSKLGKAKADETLCTMCHLGSFKGQNEIPRVAGQQYNYIVKQLRDFKTRTRNNDAGSMTSVAQTLSDTDILNLANYLAGIQLEGN